MYAALDRWGDLAPSGIEPAAALEPKPEIVRYERASPGELIHLDIKTLGKIDGVGHCITGQHERHHRARGIGRSMRARARSAPGKF